MKKMAAGSALGERDYSALNATIDRILDRAQKHCRLTKVWEYYESALKRRVAGGFDDQAFEKLFYYGQTLPYLRRTLLEWTWAVAAPITVQPAYERRWPPSRKPSSKR